MEKGLDTLDVSAIYPNLGHTFTEMEEVEEQLTIPPSPEVTYSTSESKNPNFLEGIPIVEDSSEVSEEKEEDRSLSDKFQVDFQEPDRPKAIKLSLPLNISKTQMRKLKDEILALIDWVIEAPEDLTFDVREEQTSITLYEVADDKPGPSCIKTEDTLPPRTSTPEPKAFSPKNRRSEEPREPMDQRAMTVWNRDIGIKSLYGKKDLVINFSKHWADFQDFMEVYNWSLGCIDKIAVKMLREEGRLNRVCVNYDINSLKGFACP